MHQPPQLVVPLLTAFYTFAPTPARRSCRAERSKRGVYFSLRFSISIFQFWSFPLLATSPLPLELSSCGDGADFRILNHAAAYVLKGCLQHSATQIRPAHIEVRKRAEQFPHRNKPRVHLRHARRWLRVDERCPPAVRLDQLDQVRLHLRFH